MQKKDTPNFSKHFTILNQKEIDEVVNTDDKILSKILNDIIEELGFSPAAHGTGDLYMLDSDEYLYLLDDE